MNIQTTEQNSWHIDKKMTVGHIITTLTVGVACFLYITAMEKRISLLEAKQEILKEEQLGLAATMERGFEKLDLRLDRIYDKLDKKTDKQ